MTIRIQIAKNVMCLGISPCFNAQVELEILGNFARLGVLKEIAPKLSRFKLNGSGKKNCSHRSGSKWQESNVFGILFALEETNNLGSGENPTIFFAPHIF